MHSPVALSQAESTTAPRRYVMRKLPHVTALFWILKILAVTLGETVGDLLGITLKTGYVVAAVILAAFLLIVAVLQVRASRGAQGWAYYLARSRLFAIRATDSQRCLSAVSAAWKRSARMGDGTENDMVNSLHRSVAAVAAALVAGLLLNGCGSAPAGPRAPVAKTTASEVNSAGDIPDAQVYVPFSVQGVFTVSVPEGWARSTDGNATVFTDKTNTVRLEAGTRPSTPTVDSVKRDIRPGITPEAPGYSVKVVQRQAGPAVLATYQATSAPNPVTGKTVTDEVQRYTFWHAGHTAVVTLAGPVGADNVDPWNTITNSLQWK
ncbi:hypothetical protein ACQ86B_22435 [Mycolicibacterium aichiense]|uniref:hypothetical protein n=1 Tax=Mycolicibacterium aichiense TaxID=1799 RepID=UPI003D66E0F2